MQKPFYIFSSAAIKRKDNTVFLETDGGPRYIPVENISEIHIFGEVDVTKKFLELCSQKEIIVHYYNYYGYYVGSFYPREHLNSGYMILRQAEHYLDPDKRYTLARSFVVGALKNIRAVIKYYVTRDVIDKSAQEEVEAAIKEIGSVGDIPSLMAIEGRIRQMYYGLFDLILGDPDFVFEGRSRRPPMNNLNSLISFCNSLLYTAILSEVYRTHLDPRIGYLHATNFRRFTLNLDVAEIFKPLIIDRMIFRLIQKNMITASNFVAETGGIFLKESGRKTVIKEFDRRMTTTIRHRRLKRNVSYRRLLRLELYKLEKHLMGEEEYEPFTSRW